MTHEEADGSPGDGSPDDYTVSRPVNGVDDVTINGIEAGVQYAFDFLPQPWNGFGSLDASISLTVLPNVTVFLEAINVLDDVRIEYNAPARRIGNETYGSRYFLGVRARM